MEVIGICNPALPHGSRISVISILKVLYPQSPIPGLQPHSRLTPRFSHPSVSSSPIPQSQLGDLAFREEGAIQHPQFGFFSTSQFLFFALATSNSNLYHLQFPSSSLFSLFSPLRFPCSSVPVQRILYYTQRSMINSIQFLPFQFLFPSPNFLRQSPYLGYPPAVYSDYGIRRSIPVFSSVSLFPRRLFHPSYTFTVASDNTTRRSISPLSNSQFLFPSAVVLSQLTLTVTSDYVTRHSTSVFIFQSFFSSFSLGFPVLPVPCSLFPRRIRLYNAAFISSFSIRNSLIPILCSQFRSAIVSSRLYFHSNLGLFNALFSSFYPSRPVSICCFLR